MVLSPQIFQINIPNSSENCCCVNIFTASFVYFPALRGGGEQKTPRRSASPVPGASGWSLLQPPSRDGRRDGLSPSTITPGAITPLPSWPLPFPSLYSYGSRTSLRNPLPAFRQPHPSPPRLERGGREHKSLSHIQALAQPHPLPRVTLPPELLFCSSLASRCAPLPRKGLFPLAQGLPGSGLGAAWHSAVLGPAVIPSAHVCTRVALQELRGTQKMSSQLPPKPSRLP